MLDISYENSGFQNFLKMQSIFNKYQMINTSAWVQKDFKKIIESLIWVVGSFAKQ